jgi:hypothetical protein
MYGGNFFFEDNNCDTFSNVIENNKEKENKEKKNDKKIYIIKNILNTKLNIFN